MALVLALALGTAACGDGGGPSRGARASTLAPDFDGSAAFELLRTQVEFGPRAPGTPGHARQLAWMEEYLRSRADTVILQPFTHVTASGDSLRLTNVFARFRPEMEDRLLLLAHWDTRPTADEDPDPARRGQPILGANDGASGTAALLHLADLLAREAPPVGVDLLFTDGEDWAPNEMYLGATYFAANLPPGYDPLYGVLLDMVADRNPVFPVEGHSRQYAPEVVDRVWRLAHELGYGAFFPLSPGPAVIDDHVPLNQAGIRTIDIIDFEFGPGNRYWHTHQDDLSNVSAGGLEAVGEVITELVYRGG